MMPHYILTPTGEPLVWTRARTEALAWLLFSGRRKPSQRAEWYRRLAEQAGYRVGDA